MKKLKALILNKLFKLSNQPVLLKDLLDANSQLNEGLGVDPAKLHFRLKSTSAYLCYFIICMIVLLPCLLTTHHFFTKVDFHVSIIATVLLTSLIFIGFDVFKKSCEKAMCKKLIIRAWTVHFPFFNYEGYSNKVEEIYNKALRENISKNLLEKYILDELLKVKSS